MKAQSQSSSTPKKHSESQKESWTCKRALAELRWLGEKRNVEGMARFGIVAKNVYGVAKPKIDELARRIGTDHELALKLWDTGVHDARILAGMIDEPEKVTAAQMNRWVRDFDNWDVCDGTCCHLFVSLAPRGTARGSGRSALLNLKNALALPSLPISPTAIRPPPTHKTRKCCLFCFEKPTMTATSSEKP